LDEILFFPFLKANYGMRTIALQNLGCSKNMIDGEHILSYLGSCGFTVTDDFDKAGIILVNTCTFIQEATEEAIQAIMEMARYKTEGCCTTLVVSGCFSQRYRATIKNEFPEVDLWVGVHTWAEELNRYFKTGGGAPSYKRRIGDLPATEYIKISDGCSHRCAYCIIPSIRGVFKSRPVESLVAEASWLYEQGIRECIIVSQDTSYYGRDSGTSLARLLETLLEKTRFHWIRMLYLHPGHIDDELLRLVAGEQRLCSYFDIPLQHIADPVLKRMRRTPSSGQIRALIERIRTLAPDAALRTSFVCGFPGETNAHFLELLHFLEWARFDKVGAFPFSPEEGTAAFTMTPRPRTSTAVKRCETLLDLQKEISRQLCESAIGAKKEIIIDRVSDAPGYAFEGRTQSDAPEVDGKVYIEGGPGAPGAFIQARITGAGDYDLFAKTCIG